MAMQKSHQRQKKTHKSHHKIRPQQNGQRNSFEKKRAQSNSHNKFSQRGHKNFHNDHNNDLEQQEIKVDIPVTTAIVYNVSELNREKFSKAQMHYQKEFKQKKRQFSAEDQRWFRKLMDGGTIQDKISALTIRIKDGPFHCIDNLQQLIAIANSSHRDKSLKALFSLKDIFIHLILKKGQPRIFDDQVHENATNEELSQMYFWHKAKEIFDTIIQILIAKSNDTLEYIRRQTVIMIMDLYSSNSLYSQQILPELVNKFGDTDKVIIRLLTTKLSTCLSKQPALTFQILREIYKFMYRPNLKQEAQFYCLNFINSIHLETQESGTLQYLLRIMFIFFKKLMLVPEVETRCPKLLTQVLRGINKTIPYAKKQAKELKQVYDEHEDLIYKLVAQSSSFKIKIQGLYFVYQIQNEALSDRYYRTLYELMLHQELEHTSLIELFFDLLFFSVKNDEILQRQKAIIKRLFQVKRDKNQIFKVAIHTSPAFIITCLIFVSKIFNEVPALKSMIKLPEQNLNDDDDDEECFKDIDSDEQVETKIEPEAPSKQKKSQAAQVASYDPLKREPKFSGANTSAFWELHALQSHFHPKVVEFAQILIKFPDNENCLQVKGHPLNDYKLSTFLARFAEMETRKTNKSSNQLKNIESINEEDIDASNRHMFKYLKKRFSDRILREATKGKKRSRNQFEKQNFQEGGEIDEEEADEFADELFEEELKKNEGEADIDGKQEYYQYIILNFSDDEDFDGQYSDDDEDDDNLGLIDEEEESEPVQKRSKKSKKRV